MSRRRTLGLHPAWFWLGGCLLLLLAWEGLARSGRISPIIMPAPAEVLSALHSDGDRFLAALRLTAAEIALALLLSWGLGVGFGLLAGGWPLLGAISGPLLSALFAVPLIILYPLLIAWVGLGPGSKVLFGFLSGFFPIALKTLAGVAEVDPRYALMARALGANGRRVFFRIRLLLALPAIFSGLRIGTVLAVIGVLVTEMLASLGGVGYLISYHRTLFDSGHVYLGLLLGLLLVLLVNGGLALLERRLGRWRYSEAMPK